MRTLDHPFILLVEEDEKDAELICDALWHMARPLPVERVRNTQRAIECLAEAKKENHPFPALVLCDFKMPEDDGLTLLAWIRASKKFGNVPFVIVIGKGARSDWQNALSMGATSFVYKDSVVNDPERFAKTVEECLNNA